MADTRPGNDYFFNYRPAPGMLLDSKFGLRGVELLDGRGEPVPAPRVVLDPRPRIPKRLSQQGNILRQRTFFNERIGPELLDHFVFSQHLTTIGHQKQQRVKGSGSEWNKPAVTVQEPVRRVQAEGPEPVYVLGSCRHEGCLTILPHFPDQRGPAAAASLELENRLHCFFQTSSMILKDLSAKRALS
jgi:hypothetical protein